nr:N-6 DNA methylase [Rhabdothermincola salaria]
MAAVVAEAASRHGVDRSRLGPLGRVPVPDEAGRVVAHLAVFDPPGGDDGPERDADRLGSLHQVLVAADERRRRGVHYTPRVAAETLVSLAWAEWESGAPDRGRPAMVLDPACGGGAFLLAAARTMHAQGVGAAEVLASLRGIDVDPLAVEVTIAALALWGWAAGIADPPLDEGVVHRADALDPTTAWWSSPGRAPDLIVGNPPFGGQLRRLTARALPAAEPGGRRHGYADTAALFLRRGVDEVAAGGVVALVQPLSVLATRDAAPVREAVGDDLVALWVPDGRLFDASVHVCAPVLRRGSGDRRSRGTVVVRSGASADPLGEVPRERLSRHRSWGPLWAEASGVPPVELGPQVLGDRCRSGAGFRDEFYAVADLVVDGLPAAEGAVAGRPPTVSRVVTTGLLEWATTGWGRRSAVLGGARYAAPMLDLGVVRASSEPRLDRVVDARTAPKVLVATQTRVVEAVVDPDGSLWPSVPVVSVRLDDQAGPEGVGDDEAELDDDEVATRLWLVAAALMAPPVTAWAVLETGGTARSAGALKLSARQVLRAPLPVDVDAWAEGAALLRSASQEGSVAPGPEAVAAFGRVLIAAHGLEKALAEEVERWWWDRHPRGGSPRNYR